MRHHDTIKGGDNFEHITATNADGSPARYRRNGATKLWKRSPARFRIPVKRGLYEYGHIDETNADQFTAV